MNRARVVMVLAAAAAVVVWLVEWRGGLEVSSSGHIHRLRYLATVPASRWERGGRVVVRSRQALRMPHSRVLSAARQLQQRRAVLVVEAGRVVEVVEGRPLLCL